MKDPEGARESGTGGSRARGACPSVGGMRKTTLQDQRNYIIVMPLYRKGEKGRRD
jgi:hypothetical protein